MSIIFVHVPKTAGTSIKQWINDNVNSKYPGKVRCPGHVPFSEVIKTHTSVEWSFAVVRNTYERLASLYFHSAAKSKRRMEKGIRNGIPDIGNTFVVETAEKGIVHFYKTFIEDGRKELHDGLWLNQLAYVQGVDTILLHNKLKDDFHIVQEKLNCYEPLTQNRNYMATETEKTNLYNTEYFELIEKHFGEEIEHFKFSRP